MYAGDGLYKNALAVTDGRESSEPEPVPAEVQWTVEPGTDLSEGPTRGTKLQSGVSSHSRETRGSCRCQFSCRSDEVDR